MAKKWVLGVFYRGEMERWRGELGEICLGRDTAFQKSQHTKPGELQWDLSLKKTIFNPNLKESFAVSLQTQIQILDNFHFLSLHSFLFFLLFSFISLSLLCASSFFFLSAFLFRHQYVRICTNFISKMGDRPTWCAHAALNT